MLTCGRKTHLAVFRILNLILNTPPPRSRCPILTLTTARGHESAEDRPRWSGRRNWASRGPIIISLTATGCQQFGITLPGQHPERHRRHRSATFRSDWHRCPPQLSDCLHSRVQDPPQTCPKLLPAPSRRPQRPATTHARGDAFAAKEIRNLHEGRDVLLIGKWTTVSVLKATR